MTNEITFTDDQKKAINYTDGNVIISAAAGSGKTTVLAQRVLNRIVTDKMDINRMLIVTFTTAAASSMKTKICNVIKKKYVETKDDRLWKQSLDINSAQISTIDSFQMKIVRENFEKLNISPNFSILDETEQTLLETNVLEELLENYYKDNDEDFLSLVSMFAGQSENEGLTNVILDLYNYLKAVPFCNNWLSSKLELYDDPELWIKNLCDEILPGITDIKDSYAKVINSWDLKSKSSANFIIEYTCVQNIYSACKSYNIGKLLSSCEPLTSHKLRISFDKYDTNQLKCKYFRDILYSICSMKILNKHVLSNLKNDLQAAKQPIKKLFDIVIQFQQNMTDAYTGLNKYSFDAISKLALQLTVKNLDLLTNNIDRTDTAIEISKKFDEIMIDEYQDINDCQDLFFRAISNNNLFIVGDVKQSIYSFRRANPQNFITKCNEFKRIELNKNFRSGQGIVNFCNFIFKNLFSNYIHNMKYDIHEELVYGAEYIKNTDTDVEVNFFVPTKTDEENGNIRQEACFVAEKICSIINSKIPIHDNGSQRPVEYKDIAVILRKGKRNFAVFEKTFKEYGIPVYLNTNESLFNYPEVNLIVDILSIIDNPYNDIPLFSVMNSPLYSFSAEDIAKIRINQKNCRLYTCVKNAAKKDPKFNSFIKDIDHYRLLSTNIPLYRLIWYIYVEREFLSYISVSDDNGNIKREHLMDFYSFAKQYGQTVGDSTSKFLDFINRCSNLKYETESRAPSRSNYIHLMTIHKSKGLEYPICIAACLSDNEKKDNNNLIIDDMLGVGASIRNKEMTAERTTFMREIISMKNKRKSIAESIRMMYVSFTRAKEKLILCSCVSNNYIKNWDKFNFYRTKNDDVSPFCVSNANSFTDFIMLALTKYSSSLITSQHNTTSDLFTYKFVSKFIPNISEYNTNSNMIISTGINNNELERRFNFTYPYKTLHIPAKLSVSELNNNTSQNNNTFSYLCDTQTLKRPKFLENSITSAEYGTLIHKFFQYADFKKCISDELSRLKQEGIFTTEDIKNINTDTIENFIHSDFYKTIISKSINIYKEQNFVVNIPIQFFDNSIKTDDKMLMQGAIDLICEYEDHLIIVDYKSSSDCKKLIAQYSKQLEFYSYAAQKLFTKPVSEMYIWSFGATTAIPIKPTMLDKYYNK